MRKYIVLIIRQSQTVIHCITELKQEHFHQIFRSLMAKFHQNINLNHHLNDVILLRIYQSFCIKMVKKKKTLFIELQVRFQMWQNYPLSLVSSKKNLFFILRP